MQTSFTDKQLQNKDNKTSETNDIKRLMTEKMIAALKNLDSDDILIIFGKGNEKFQEINGEKLYYSDREIIEEFYENWYHRKWSIC